MSPPDRGRRVEKRPYRVYSVRRRRWGWLVLTAIVAAGLAAVLTRGDGGVGSGADAPRASATRDEPLDRGSAPVPRPIVRFTVGQGARSAAIVRRAGALGPRPVVVFLHGWGLTGASAYRPWIRHLAAAGNTVIVPRYQLNASTGPDRVRGNALTGLKRALARAPAAPGSLILAGHSAGAALAADIAGLAASRGLPAPQAVFAVYPGRRINVPPGAIPEVAPARIPATTRLVALGGARDVVVGEGPAQSLVARASGVPADRRRFVRVTSPAVADHLAPTRSGRAARRAFWRRLDRLIAQARR